jgi:hypothetical protein
LPGKNGLISGRSNFSDREIVVLELQLLQAEYIRLMLLKPGNQMGQSDFE